MSPAVEHWVGYCAGCYAEACRHEACGCHCHCHGMGELELKREALVLKALLALDHEAWQVAHGRRGRCGEAVRHLLLGYLAAVELARTETIAVAV